MDVDIFETQAKQCAEAIKQSRNIVLLSGAGMSTNAGLQDFRGPNGLYRTLNISNPESIFDIVVFQQNPAFFYRFYRGFLKQLEEIQPTLAHRFFVRLEQEGKLAGIITQNIDALHQKAGSQKVYEIHGSVWKNHCTSCGKFYDYESGKKKVFEEEVPHCDKCGGVIKPDIVFFGEPVKYLDECFELAHGADLFFVVGSSLVVTPAATLPAYCPGKIIIVNKGECSTAYLPERRVFLKAEYDIDTFFQAVQNILES